MRIVLAVLLVAAACGDNVHFLIDASGTGTDGNGTDGNTTDGDATDGAATDGAATDGAGTDTGTGSNAGPTMIDLTLTNHPANAAMFTFVVAYQDGSGPWMLAPAPVGDTYSFPVSAPVYGVAWTCTPAVGGPGRQARQVNEAHFAVAERTSLTMNVPARCSDRNPTNVALTGTVTHRTGVNAGLYLVAFGGLTTFVNPLNGRYSLQTPPSTHDLFLLHVSISGNGSFAMDRVAVQRGVAVTAATTQNLDASTLVPTQVFNVTIVAANARRTATTTLYTSNGSSPQLVQDNGAPFESRALAATEAAAGDVYDQSITVVAQGETAVVTNATATPAVQTYVAPTPLGAISAAVPTTTPSPQLSSTWPAYASSVGYTWVATQQPTLAQCGGNRPCSVTWTTLLSPGAIGSAPSYQMPDLSALAGWSTGLQFVTGTMVSGTVQAMTSSAGAADFPPNTPSAGTQRAFVRSSFTVTP